VLKHENLDKFESRSLDEIFLGYALHSRTYNILNLETNCIVKICQVIFNETMPCAIFVLEHANFVEMK
jgi:hypothetical protein